ncbi:MAG: tetratricopeptide repeat protein [Saprospiraceae bacterium]
MKKFFLFLFFLFDLTFFSFAQRLSTSEISNIIRESSEEVNPEKAQKILDKVSLIVNEKNTHDSIKALYFHQQGQIFLDENQFKSADSCFNIAKSIYIKLQDYPKQIMVLNSLGNLFMRRGEYKGSKKFYKQGLAIALKSDDKKAQGMIYYNLGHICNNEGKYEEAVSLTTKAANLFKDLNDNKRFIQTNQDLALIISKFDINKGISILNKLSKNPAIDSFIMLKLMNYANLGVFYSKKKSSDSSLIYLSKALQIAKKTT